MQHKEAHRPCHKAVSGAGGAAGCGHAPSFRSARVRGADPDPLGAAALALHHRRGRAWLGHSHVLQDHAGMRHVLSESYLSLTHASTVCIGHAQSAPGLRARVACGEAVCQVLREEPGRPLVARAVQGHMQLFKPGRNGSASADHVLQR